MKHLLLTTIAVVVLVGCGPSVDIHEAAATGNIEAVKQYIAAGTDLNVKNERGLTPLDRAILYNINNQRHKWQADSPQSPFTCSKSLGS